MKQIEQAQEHAIGDVPVRSELAGAKLNLALHVTGQRADGYHTLESLVAFADYGDIVAAFPTSERTYVEVKGPFADSLSDTSPEANLVMRAAIALARASGRPRLPPRRLILIKRLPVAAGLGGGSADAAAVLRLLNREWQLGFSLEKLAAIAAPLGADVPMCVYSHPLIASGIGEETTPVSGLPALPVVIAHPGIAMPTPPVFARLANKDNPPLPPFPKRMNALLDIIFWLRRARNDLAAPAAGIDPAAAAAARQLTMDPECLFARMSGSGAAAFGIFASIAAAQRAARRIASARPDWWAAAAMTFPSENDGTKTELKA